MKQNEKDTNICATLQTVLVAVRLRATVLEEGTSGISSSEMKALAKVFPKLIRNADEDFPIDLSKYREQVQKVERELIAAVHGSRTAKEGGGGTLIPYPPTRESPNDVLVSIVIEKIGLKDAPELVEPHITIRVMDADGQELESPQDTPITNKKKGQYIMFGDRVYLQTCMQDIANYQAGIFLEFKHYKPKKSKISTKCFSVLEADELQEGAKVLEIYRKPTMPSRKKLKLLSEKPLFLHVHLYLHH